VWTVVWACQFVVEALRFSALVLPLAPGGRQSIPVVTMKTKVLFVLLLGGFGLVLAIQHRTLQQVRSEVAALRGERTAVGEDATDTRPRILPQPDASVGQNTNVANVAPSDASLDHRIAALENTVQQLVRASDYLMDRGNLPLSEIKRQELERQFFDPSTPEPERLRILRLLRRNAGMTDAIVQHSLTWLQGAAAPEMKREILQQLQGLTNALLKEPLLGLLAGDQSNRVRRQAADNLRQFMSDPSVEARLWELATKDADNGVREQAEDILRQGPFSPERTARLRDRALNTQSSWEERLIALQALRRSGQEVSDVVASMVQVAQAAEDPAVKARLFQAVDGASDPILKAPLVFGLQDPNPNVRRQAADALSEFKNDPIVMEWLKYISQNDQDPRVRREAEQALQERRRGD
jgi:hypothetical protein